MKHEQDVERQISRAFEEGKFANLAGSGKPLALGQNAFEDADRRMAFHVMKLGGVVPDWVQLGNEIESARDAIRVDIEKHEGRMQRARNRIMDDPGMDLRHRMLTLYHIHQDFRKRLRVHLMELRQKTERFNWIAPGTAAKVAIQTEAEMRAVDRAWPWPALRE